LTWRQVRRYAEVLAIRRRREQADFIEGIAAALGAKDLDAVLKRLRNG
jgi:hypothetical protein